MSDGAAGDPRRERRIALLVTLGLALGQWGSSLLTGFHTGFGKPHHRRPGGGG